MVGFHEDYRTSLQHPRALGEPEQAELVWALEAKDSNVHWKEVRERPGDKGTDGHPFHLPAAPTGLESAVERLSACSIHSSEHTWSKKEGELETNSEHSPKIGTFRSALRRNHWHLKSEATQD